ncbi:hypothetical protein [Halobacillus litoralis]|uniref:Uncharacterized protein n=1 Tax=Halobacillus litoralis TaxID=45668 RepID=A0A410ME09_9BACI|nr:hypothetical protein [Halobacillus litoralis]QAS52953.1 hypothetical protein HLI_12490 [Halobacillus litoralis]
MHKIYLSIIVFLTLVLVIVLTTSSDNLNNVEPIDNAEERKGERSEQTGVPAESIKEYFLEVEPKKDIYKEWDSAAIQLDKVPEDERKESAAGLLLEAKKSVNADGYIAVPTLENLNNFFAPSDQQLKKLIKENDGVLPIRINKTHIQLKQAGELIEDDRISDQLNQINEELVDIEIYNKDTLYDFSVAFDRYKHCIKNVLQITSSIQ